MNTENKILKMAELVSYQEGSVVSREVIKKSAGNVTVFAFDEGQGLSEHKAPFDALVYILEGSAEIKIDGNPHDLQQGEMIIMPANIPHEVKSLSKFKMALIMIKE